jgi:hypothetical protein
VLQIYNNIGLGTRGRMDSMQYIAVNKVYPWFEIKILTSNVVQ